MNSTEIKETFINFFKQHDHLEIPNSSLIPEHDPTLLFVNSGMAPLKNYFQGVLIPPRDRMTNVQRCLRTEDLEEVGLNTRTLTFFEMLGSWSVNGYGKKEAISLAFNLLIDKYQLDPSRLYATIFNGDKYAPFDQEAFDAWIEVGLEKNHIIPRGAEDNFWVSGPVGPCGPCTEVLYDLGSEFSGKTESIPGEDSDRFLEIWNAGVFMQYDRQEDGHLVPLPFFSVDTGAGLERLAMVLQKVPSVYETDRFAEIIQTIEKISDLKYQSDQDTAVHFRILADHSRAITFALGDGITPSNNERGYVIRRLIRRAIMAGKSIDINGYFLNELAEVVISGNASEYPHLLVQKMMINNLIDTEERRFSEVLASGEKLLVKLINSESKIISGEMAFRFYDTYGLPLSALKVLARKHGLEIDTKGFDDYLNRQQERSRMAGKTAKEAMAALGPEVAKNHTAAHLLNEALRKIISPDITQAGQDLSSERLRFDFNFDRALTAEEIAAVEQEVNSQINKGLPVTSTPTTYEKAKELGAQALFAEKYQSVDEVILYSIGDYSRELCGGPHVNNTSEIKEFKILKQESIGRGVRRIKAKAT